MKHKDYRNQLFDYYKKYVRELSNLLKISFVQWINGSFVTKELKPKDIDLVSFIDYRAIEKVGHDIKSLIYPNSKSNFNVDAYIVKVYPSDHKYNFAYETDRLYWLHQFLKTRPNKQGKQYNKGFIKLECNYEKLQ